MAIFKQRRKSKASLLLEKTFHSDGIVFVLQKNGEPITLPISLSLSEIKALDNLNQWQLLEDLWLDEQLIQTEQKSYLLPYENLYLLDPQDRKSLDLPDKTTPVNIMLDNERFVGSEGFRFTPEIAADMYPNLDKVGKRKGAIIELPTKEVLLIPQAHYELLELIDNLPENREDIFAYIAQVKKKAESLGVPLSEHIQRENYEFIEEVDLNIANKDNQIQFSPLFHHDKLDDHSLEEVNKATNGYTKIGNQRVFVDKKAVDQAEKIKQIEPIKGKDIPHFVQNPEAYLPEEININMEQFGERVKGLGIRVYKAQPFIHAEQTNNGWFEFDAGYTVKDDEGNSILQEDSTFFSDSESDEFKQIDDNTFISIPEKAEEFNELSTNILNEAKQNPTNQLIPSNYILEIFENITNIEYNRPLLEIKEALYNDQVFEKTPPPSIFTATLKPFQEDGFVWMKSLGVTGSGGLLADDMGLGKTVQVIAYLAYLKEREQLGPSLLVLPKSLIDNWINEMGKFAPSLTENLHVHLGPCRTKNFVTLSNFDIVLTTYQTLIRDQLIMGRVNWQVVICDEAQAIKNPTTSVSIVVKALKNKRRLALTGTPVENSLSELWSILDFVQPGLLGSLKEFKNQYEAKLANEDNYDDIRNNIEDKIHFIYKRRTKRNELKGQLPSKIEHKIPVQMGKEQQMMYLEILNQVKEKKIPAIQGIMDLKMLCSHPGLLDGSLKFGRKSRIPKLTKTIKILKGIQNKGEKALIFTEYRAMQIILKQEIIREFQLNAAIINGAVDKRQSIVDQFNQKEGFDILILSPKAAGTGLTITSANHVIHYTRWWNPAVENQATDRVYRIGQEKDVHVYYPIIASKSNGNTVEEVVDELLTKKNELAENVIVPSKDMDIEKEVLGEIRN